MPGSNPSEDGGTTQELQTRFDRARQQPGESRPVVEQRMRSRGVWLIISGALGVGLVMLGSIVWSSHNHGHMPGVYAMPLYFISVGSIFLGAMEVMFRPHRDLQANVLDEIARIEHGLRLLVHLLPKELQQSWYAGYGSGHQDGRNARTGTDNGSGVYRTTGDVLPMRRNGPR